MDFGEALKNLKAGKPVRRVPWPKDVVLTLATVAAASPRPALIIGRAWTFGQEDLLADDWTLVEETP